MKLFIIGQPGECGGACTELLDQIKIWKLMGLEIHIIPTKDDYVCNDDEIVIHKKCDWKEIDGNQCISFCNKTFLQNLEFIKPYSKKTIWVNCMTYAFPEEIKCQDSGLIDLHLYQSCYSYDGISYKLKYLGKPYNYSFFHPYFDSTGFDYNPLKNNEKFCFGRISRGDIKKYSSDQFKIYDQINHPDKYCCVLGITEDIKKRIYVPSQKTCGYTIQLYKPNEISRYEFYNKIDILCMKTETIENLPRVGFECMASGTLLVVDNRGGWKLLVDDNITGFLCSSMEEFIEKMNFISKNQKIKINMADKAFIKLQNEYSMDKSMNDWKNILYN